MSAKNIRAAIERFLVSDTPQVLCIRGAWGTGKTFNWKTISRELRDKPAAIALNEYSYVSLFGLNSLNEVKTQILQSMVVRAQIGNPPDLTSFGNAISTVESGLKKGVIKTVTSVLGSRGDALVSAMGFFTNRVIVCLDDFERKGAKLSNTDVLGLVTYLKEERDCKVVLLLNDMKLDDRKTFDNYLEKVVDLDLRFEPTPEEIANIAIPEDGRDNIGEMVRANAITLGINNVRVIRKIIGLVRDVAPMLTEYSFRVTMNATSTITLLGWSYFQPELAPPLDYLKRVNTFAPHKDENELDLKWRDLLLKYRYHSSSPFDLTLLKGIENGYFEEAEIDKHAVELHNADVKDKSDNEMKEIWDELYYTFIKPQKSTFDRFYEAYTRNIELMSLGTMGHIEKLFRELNDNRAGEVVDLYIDANKNTAGAFDVSSSMTEAMNCQKLSGTGWKLQPGTKSPF
ncbi:P-loop NTPase fold protein [Rhizobium ruizarguesonis]